MNPVEVYIEELPPHAQELSEILRHFILSANDGIKEKIAYGIPFFYRNRNICYINPLKKGVDLGFVKGSAMTISASAFELKGRKKVKSIYIANIKEVDFELLDQILQEALLLDQGKK